MAPDGVPDAPVASRRVLAVALAALLPDRAGDRAIAPSLLTSGIALRDRPRRRLQSPSLEHPFGTDQSGRDVYTRVVYGARESLLIGLGATALGLGRSPSLLGFAAGLGGKVRRRRASAGCSRSCFSFPSLLLALLFVAILGRGVSTQIVAVGIGVGRPATRGWSAGRSSQVKDSDYVIAARALGHPPGRIIARTSSPTRCGRCVVLATLGVGQSIVWASALSFLGLGVAPPAPEWGAMLDAGRDYIQTAWWLEFFPGAAIVAFTLAVTCLGRYLQRRIEGEGR